MGIGSKVVVTARHSSYFGLRGEIVAVPVNQFPTPHWMVLMVYGTVPMLFGEKELKEA